MSFRGSQWWEKLRELTKEEEAKAPVCTEIKCYFKCLICKDLVSGLSTEPRFDFQDSFYLTSAGGSGESLPRSTLSRCLCKRNAGHEDRVTRGQNTGWMIFTVFFCFFFLGISLFPVANAWVCFCPGMVSEPPCEVEEKGEVLGPQQRHGGIWAVWCYGPSLHSTSRIHHQLGQEWHDGLLRSLASRWASRWFFYLVLKDSNMYLITWIHSWGVLWMSVWCCPYFTLT